MLLLGQVTLALGFVAALVAVGALLWGRSLGEKAGESITNAGYYATFAAFGTMTVAALTMLMAFLRNDFTFMYVAENHPTDVSSLAWLYRVSGVWAGREGSLLFWAWLVACFAAYVAYKRMDQTDDLSNMGLMVTNVVAALFGGAMMFSEPNNPFKASPAEWIGPAGELLTSGGMNPLLQHWAMILHPPTLFIGYAGLTIPFAFALASLIVGDSSSRWIEIVDRISVFSWLFLGAGIGLGSVWAYVVLGWGGYWAWDPVENASLLPWLTGVAMLHSFTIYRRRDGFKRWAVMTSALTFSMVILGTFITRSGIVQSVHAFQADPVSTWLFGFMIVAPLVATAFALWLRGDQWAGNDEFESLTSKEAAYYFNNLIMVVAGILVAYMTVSSALPSWMPFGGQSIGITAYDLLARPIGVFYAFIIAVCPILSWRKTDSATFWSRIKYPLIAAALIFALLVAEWVITLQPVYGKMVALGGKGAAAFLAFGPEWVYSAIALLGFLAASLLISNTGALFIEGARKRAAAKGESFASALGNILLKARTQSGGYIAHISIGIILIGLVGSAMYVEDVRSLVPATPGSKFSASNYEFTYQGTNEVQQPNGDVISKATFSVTRDGKAVGSISPGKTNFARQGQTRLDAAVLSEPLRDLFVVWEGNQDNQLSINVKINPLIWFAWGGFALLLLGSALAAWPKNQPRLVAVDPKRSTSRAKSGKR
jgi:cytochrome c-type biogenesis protein CcmF